MKRIKEKLSEKKTDRSLNTSLSFSLNNDGSVAEAANDYSVENIAKLETNERWLLVDNDLQEIGSKIVTPNILLINLKLPNGSSNMMII